MSKPALIVDIDGTIATMGARGIYEFDKSHLDACNDTLRTMLNNWRAVHFDRTVIMVTGRQERWRDHTTKWLTTNKIRFDQLYMRPNGDGRSSEEVKRDIYFDLIKPHFEVMGVFEDHMGNAKMFKRLGLTVYYVGDFDAAAREAPTMEQERLA